jgi:hypothetical protein
MMIFHGWTDTGRVVCRGYAWQVDKNNIDQPVNNASIVGRI